MLAPAAWCHLWIRSRAPLTPPGNIHTLFTDPIIPSNISRVISLNKTNFRDSHFTSIWWAQVGLLTVSWFGNERLKPPRFYASKRSRACMLLCLISSFYCLVRGASLCIRRENWSARSRFVLNRIARYNLTDLLQGNIDWLTFSCASSTDWAGGKCPRSSRISLACLEGCQCRN